MAGQQLDPCPTWLPLIGQWDGKAERTGAGKNAALRAENARLAERVEATEDRIAVLERIVTDRGFDIAHQIESLRDRQQLVAGTRQEEAN